MNNSPHQIVLTILGGFLAATAGIVASICADWLTARREKLSAIETRRRHFVAFIQSWKFEMGRWYLVVGGLERGNAAFADVVSTFIQEASLVKGDLSEEKANELDTLCRVITAGQIAEVQSKGRYEAVTEALDKICKIVDPGHVHANSGESATRG